MQVIDLDGNISSWNISGNSSKANNINKSSFHLLARDIIKKIYPTMPLLEEVTINIRKSEFLYLDFYIPMIKTCMEVHGEQHYKFIPFFHGTQINFLSSRANDNNKIEWCSVNGITLVELPFNESDEQWKSRIQSN